MLQRLANKDEAGHREEKRKIDWWEASLGLEKSAMFPDIAIRDPLRDC